MKYFTVASAVFVAAAVAQPHGSHHRRHHEHEKRALYTETKWVTETQYVTELVDSTTTVWLGYGATSSEQAKFVETSHSKASSTSTPTSTSEAYEQPETTTSSSSVYVAPTTSSSSSVYVAPPQSSTTKEEVKSTYVAPVPTTTSVYVAPSSTYVAPVATTSASSGSGSGSGSGTTYSGEITYYTLGLGSCGETETGLDDSSNTVAIAAGMMGGSSYDTSLCGKTITITANGKSCQGVIRDKCMGCSGNDIDVSEKIFNELWGGLTKGRGNVEWSFN